MELEVLKKGVEEKSRKLAIYFRWHLSKISGVLI